MKAAVAVALAGVLASPLQIRAAPRPSPAYESPAPAAVAWLRARATPAGDADSPPMPIEAAAIDRLAAGAQIVAFGEASHFTREPLAYRNRLIRYLVEHSGVRIVALESGIAEGRRVHDYVAGGPGEAVAVVREGLSWGFGGLEENVALATWLRAWNADHPGDRVAFYGYDVSGGDVTDGLGGAVLALDDVDRFLARAAPARAPALRAELARLAPRFSSAAYPGAPAGDRAALHAAVAAVRALIETDRAALVAASSAQDYDWARQEAFDCDRLLAVLDTWPDFPTQWPKVFAVSKVRDAAMADHLAWILQREGPGSKMVMFAANGHVSASPLMWGEWRGLKVDMPPVGQHLRARLGDRYRAIVTLPRVPPAKDGRPPPADSLNAQLAAAGQAPLWVDLRGAERSAPWRRGMRFAGPAVSIHKRAFDTYMVAPGSIDAVLFLDRMTPETVAP